ncbi:DAK2 domain fusion protein YloV, partial [gut metagenome]
METAGAVEFSGAMADGVDAAYKAVMKPAEGTILTVSRLASEAAVEAAGAGASMENTLACAIEAGEEALENTVNLNPVLKKAGVVDAGGKGYIVILKAMFASFKGEIEAPTEAPSDKTPEAAQTGADFADFNTEDIRFSYCTEFIVERENTKDPALLRAFLEELGDCVVVVDDDEIIKVHVHTNDPGKALSEAVTYGHFVTVKVENMKLQHSAITNAGNSEAAQGAKEPEVEEDVIAEPEKEFGIVTVCAGSGMENLFLELGADRVVTGGQTMNPSTDDILKEINKTPASTV